MTTTVSPSAASDNWTALTAAALSTLIAEDLLAYMLGAEAAGQPLALAMGCHAVRTLDITRPLRNTHVATQQRLVAGSGPRPSFKQALRSMGFLDLALRSLQRFPDESTLAVHGLELIGFLIRDGGDGRAAASGAGIIPQIHATLSRYETDAEVNRVGWCTLADILLTLPSIQTFWRNDGGTRALDALARFGEEKTVAESICRTLSNIQSEAVLKEQWKRISKTAYPSRVLPELGAFLASRHASKAALISTIETVLRLLQFRPLDTWGEWKSFPGFLQRALILHPPPVETPGRRSHAAGPPSGGPLTRLALTLFSGKVSPTPAVLRELVKYDLLSCTDLSATLDALLLTLRDTSEQPARMAVLRASLWSGGFLVRVSAWQADMGSETQYRMLVRMLFDER